MSRRLPVPQQLGNSQEVVGQYGCAHQNLETLAAFGGCWPVRLLPRKPRNARGLWPGSASSPVPQQLGNSQEVVGQYGCAHQNLETLAAFGPAALHPPAAKQHRDAALDAHPKALPVLELNARLRSKASCSAVFCPPRWGMHTWLTPACWQWSTLSAL